MGTGGGLSMRLTVATVAALTADIGEDHGLADKKRSGAWAWHCGG